MSANSQACADKDKSVCDYNEFRRLRYFHGMLLDDKDFQAEQLYHSGKRRFLNRMLHGSGVVCGLELRGKKEERWIEITSGFALDCSGNEIWVQKNQNIDLASLLPKGKGKPGAECLDEEHPEKPKTYYIGIRYDEKPTNPVSVYLPSGNCEERTCENSRYKEGFCVEIVECSPESETPGLIKGYCDCENNIKPGKPTRICGTCDEFLTNSDSKAASNNLYGDDLDKKACLCVTLEEFCEQSVACPECCSCDKPCFVVLGQITLDKECKLLTICNNECRRYVLTPHLLRHMLLGVFAGFEDYFFVDVEGERIKPPTATELVDNPIKALCWALQYFVVKEGKRGLKDCKGGEVGKEGSTKEQFNRINEGMERFSSAVSEDFRNHADRLRALEAVVFPTEADKPPKSRK